AQPDGFEIHFTLPVDSATALDPASYRISSFDYLYHEIYGSDAEDVKEANIKGIRLASDGKSVRLILDEMRAGYIYEVTDNGIREQATGSPLLHPLGYYSLNAVPAGQTIAKGDQTVKWMQDSVPQPAAAKEELSQQKVVAGKSEPQSKSD